MILRFVEMMKDFIVNGGLFLGFPYVKRRFPFAEIYGFRYVDVCFL